MVPGNVYAYTYGDGFIHFDCDGGTSVASSRLSAFASLLNNLVPQSSPVDVREAILRTAEIRKVENYKSSEHGWSILNVDRALRYLKSKFNSSCYEPEKKRD